MSEPRTKSPFPGMDPYLEQYWGDVHHSLCTYGRDLIRKTLPPGLIARTDERTVIEDPLDDDRIVIPDIRVIERGRAGTATMEVPNALDEPMVIDVGDEAVIEGFIQVIDIRNGGRVITVIEFTSPTNKISSAGRAMYRQKQRELLGGGVSLVEVDLIRSGPWILRVPEEKVERRGRGVYHTCVTRGWRINKPEVYAIKLQDRLPTIRIPLRQSDHDASLDLQALIDQVYENGSYGYDVDYTKPPVPPLGDNQANWAKDWLPSRL